MSSNPFTIMFGKNPNLVIDRPIPKSEIIDAFSQEKINQQIYLITSIRGSGKTVLMTQVCDYFRDNEKWIVIELNPNVDMIEALLSKLNSQVGYLLKTLNVNLSLFNIVTVGAGIESRITDKETAVSKIFEHLKKIGKRVLIAVDEVYNSANMRVFASAFQILVRNELPVFLLMTGMHSNIKNLQDEKSLTFLYRAPKINLGPLNMRSIQNQYAEVFSLKEEDAKRMAELTKGYAFAFQALGFLTYRHGGDYKAALDEYRQYLEEYSYQKIWSELSEGDKKVVKAMAKAPSDKVKDIMEVANLDNGHFNPYRKRLIDKGVANGENRGKLIFVLPLWKEFVLDSLL